MSVGPRIHAAVISVSMIATLQVSSSVLGAEPTQKDSPKSPKVGLTIKKPGAFSGYSLVAPMNSTSTYLIDLDGKIVNEWKSKFTPALSAYLLENGHLLRPGSERGFGPGSGGRIQEFDWGGDLVWDYSFGDSKVRPHHDIRPLPNGNVLVVASDPKTSEEAIAAGRRPASVHGQLLPDCILEIKPTGKTTGQIVWEWHAWDHLIQDADKAKPNYGEVAERPERIDVNFTAEMMDRMMSNPAAVRQLQSLGYVGGGTAPDDAKKSGTKPSGDRAKDGDKPPSPPGKPSSQGNSDRRDGPRRGFGRRGGPGPMGGDWMHVNAVAYNAKLDQIMISVHEFSEVWIIDHSTTTAEAASSKGGRRGKGGDLLYRWGNPRAYRSGSNADQRLFAQHSAHWIDDGLPGAGHMLVFNNGSGRPGGGFSSIDEVVLPLKESGLYEKEPDLAFGPTNTVWSFSASKDANWSSMLISGAQRLPNGNTFICSGNQARLLEVTPTKEVVWEFKYPGGGFGGPLGGPRRFRQGGLVPGFLEEMLELTDQQKESIRTLEGDVNSRVKALLTADQQEKMNRPEDDDRMPGPGPGPMGPPDGFRPPRVGEVMSDRLIKELGLSKSQADEVTKIRQLVSERLAKIWNEEQKRQLKEFEGFAAGPGFGPPGGGPGFGPPDGGPGFGPPGDRPPDGGRRRPGGFGRGGGPGRGPGGIFRSYRYATDYPGLARRVLKPGKSLADDALESARRRNDPGSKKD